MPPIQIDPLRHIIQSVLQIISRRSQLLMSGLLAMFLLESGTALADWRNDVGTFRIGMIASSNSADAIARVEPFRLAIAEALGIKVEVVASKNYRALVEAQVAARIEYAIYSASAYAAAWKLCSCVEPLVLPKSSDGADSYQSIVIAAGGGPSDINQLTASSLAGLSKSSFAGYKFAAYELAKQGIDLPDNVIFAKTGEEAVAEFLAGGQQALIGWSSLIGDPSSGYSRGTLRLIADRNDGKVIPYRVIWRSSPIPHRPHVIRKTLDSEAKTLLREILSRMHSSDPVAYDSIEPVFGGGFAIARHSQFLPIISYVESLQDVKPPQADNNPSATENN